MAAGKVLTKGSLAEAIAPVTEFKVMDVTPVLDSLAGVADHDEELLMVDMCAGMVTINEQCAFLEAAMGFWPALGLWIGGERYTITQSSSETVGEGEVEVVFAFRPLKGLYLVATVMVFVS